MAGWHGRRPTAVLDTACRLSLRTTVPRPSSDLRPEGAMDDTGSDRRDGSITAREADQRGNDAERSAADADQTASDADQTASDADQTATERDEADAASDQRASEEDQASADQQLPVAADGAALEAYEASRVTREAGTISRQATQAARARTSRLRVDTAAGRDATATARDEIARRRDVDAQAIDRSIAASNVPLAKKLKQVRRRAAADRSRAAADRARAAGDRARAAADRDRAGQDRADAASERARLQGELNSAHLDDLTGVFRREMGRLVLTREMDRARRGDGRFVIAFVDVDGLKGINDLKGHAAGDHALQAVVSALRSGLRSFDPIVRHGGDEFVCGLGGADLNHVARRFDAIGLSLRNDVGVGISVGLAALAAGETLDELTGRADVALLDVREARGE